MCSPVEGGASLADGGFRRIPVANTRLAAQFPTVDARAVSFADFELPPHSVDVALFAWSL